MTVSAVADVDRGVVHARVEIAAPPETVFRALTDPRALESWWGSAETYRTFDWAIDLRPGGKWSCAARNADDQRISTVRGEYRAVEPPRLLEYTWESSWDGFIETMIRIELEPTAAGTRVTVTHSGFAGRPEQCHGHGEGWRLVLGWLAAPLAPQTAEVMS